MVFTSFQFLVFFSVIFMGYYTIMNKKKWQWLLLASYVFYMCASPLYVVFLIASTLVTFLGALGIDRINNTCTIYVKTNKETLTREERKKYQKDMEKKARTILITVIILMLGLLGVLKYAMFVLDNVKGLFGLVGIDFREPHLQVMLPIGLSFYTFQSLGYCIDIYRGSYGAQRNLAKYALFVSYFPQILQGPIGSYETLAPKLYEDHTFDYERVVQGALRVAWGFMKKMVIADSIAMMINPVFSDPKSYEGIAIAFALVLYSIQLYADFSGFMDIAIGCSSMLGIQLDENFDSPYFSKDIPEFWRRWHMSLGAWFRNYVFYSILRNGFCDKVRKNHKKKGKQERGNILTTVYSLAIVWLLIGIWHGADWSYILYGIYYGAIIISSTVLAGFYHRFYERFPKLKENKGWNLFRILRTFAIVTAGYTIFRPADLNVTLELWKSLASGLGIASLKVLLTGMKLTFMVTCLTTLLLFLYDGFSQSIDIYSKFRKQKWYVRWSAYVAILILIMVFKAGVAQQFTYFKF